MGKHVERQRVRTCLKKCRLKTKRLHWFNFGLHDEAVKACFVDGAAYFSLHEV